MSLHEHHDDDVAGDDADDGAVVLQIDDVDDPIAHLLQGEIEIEGRMPHSSNGTYLVHVVADEVSHPAIYKPMRHERPLWDFEPGLHRREVATYLLSEAMGFGAVPPTVLRDGPLGEGSLQWFVAGDFRHHYFTIYEQFEQHHEYLRDIAILDVVANNTDRKSGHCLLGIDRVWAIDHGLTFAAEFKLRTVIWEFGGEPLDERRLDAVRTVHESVPLGIAALLSDREVEAICDRAGLLLRGLEFPTDPSGRRYPWPLV